MGQGKGGASGNTQKLRKTSEQVDKGGPADIDSQINSTMQQYQELLDHRESRKVSGGKVICLNSNCKKEFTAGVGDFCGVCGSNQNVEMAAALKN